MAIEIGFAVGALILLGAMIYAATQYGRRGEAAKIATDQATKDLYRDGDAYDKGAHDAAARRAGP